MKAAFKYLKKLKNIFIKNPIHSSTYCVNFFTQVATDNLGYFKPCCQFKGAIKNEGGAVAHPHNITPLEFFNCGFMKESREKVLNNKPVRGCEYCYKMEANGIKSMRQRHNIERSALIKKIKHRPAQPRIYSLDLRLGNLCNLGCIMCHPEASSVLASEWSTHGYEKFSRIKPELDLVSWYKKNDVIDVMKQQTQDLVHLSLIGGEPLINKKNFELLSSLRGQGKNLNLEISTNLTFLNEQILTELALFNTDLKCSIDGIDKYANYIRYPSDFETIKKNIHLLIGSDIKFEFVFTVSVLNILHIKDFYFWFKELSLGTSRRFGFSVTNIVNQPVYLSPENLSKEIKSKAIQELLEIIADIKNSPKLNLSENSFYELISYLEKTEGDMQVIRNGWRHIENYDKIRGNSWKEVSPWLSEILN